MGNVPKKYAKTSDVSDDKDEVLSIQQTFSKQSIPLALKVAHYTPSSFPMIPLIDRNTCKALAESWKLIVDNQVVDDMGNTTSGITAFYSTF